MMCTAGSTEAEGTEGRRVAWTAESRRRPQVKGRYITTVHSSHDHNHNMNLRSVTYQAGQQRRTE